MRPELKPPSWIDSLLNKLAPPDLAEEIQGDLYELFIKDLHERSFVAAKRRYVFNGLGFLAKSFFWKKRTSIKTPPWFMLSSYFKMAYRSLLAYKGTTAINILGLVTGIASALVILTVIRFESSFDTFHSRADRTYRVVRVSGDSAANPMGYRTGISYPVPVAMKSEIASLENIASIQYEGGAFIEVTDAAGSVIRKFQEDHGGAFVEPSFFNIFDFKDTGFRWIAGNPEALTEPFSVVLTKTMAKKYFPDGNAVGNTLRFQRRTDCKVTGVIEDLPANTDFPLTFLVSYSTMKALRGEERGNDWSSVDDEHQTYLVLPPGVTQRAIEKQIARVHAAHTDKDLNESRRYLLQPLRELHHDTHFTTYRGRVVSRQTLLTLTLVGLFLLLTAAINYINLSTAQSVMRSKEIGLRKVMGSNRKSIVSQILMETFLVVLMAGVLALMLSEVFLVSLQPLLNIPLTGYNFTEPFILLSLLGVIFLLTLFAGMYPSFVISRFNPVTALKNKFTTNRMGGFSLRKVLVVAQFTITQILVVGTFIVVAQMKFFQNTDMGFNPEAVITVNLPDRDPHKRERLGVQLWSQSFVAGVSFSYTFPSGADRNRSAQDISRIDATASKDHMVYENQGIDTAYLRVHQIKLLAGRNLAMQDSFRNVLINKTLARNLAFGTPEEALGKEVKMNGQPRMIVGVIDDFYPNSLKEGVGNIAMVINPRAYAKASIRLALPADGRALQEAIRKIEKIWSSAFPEYIFDYQFQDENIKAFYANEQKYAQLFQLFSVIFLLIGCLGLYGLITFAVNRKGKEVAIRKVLGATITNIIMIFSREYMQLIVLSFLIAVPIAYYAVDSWLSNFQNHIGLHWWLFVTPGLMVLMIAILVIGSKSVKTATANPVDKLKYE